MGGAKYTLQTLNAECVVSRPVNRFRTVSAIGVFVWRVVPGFFADPSRLIAASALSCDDDIMITGKISQQHCRLSRSDARYHAVRTTILIKLIIKFETTSSLP